MSSNASNSSSSSSTSALRSPPHSIEAEEAVLGGILIDNSAINIALERSSPGDYYKPAHQQIFSACLALSERQEPIDIVTLSNQLRTQADLDRCGGIEYLSRLAAGSASSANVGFYAKIVKEMAVRRRIIGESSGIIQDAYNAEEQFEAFLDKAETRFLKVCDYRTNPSFSAVGDVVQDAIRIVEQLYDRKEPITGVPTGFDKLDNLTAGFQPAELIIVAARPAMGKTALVMSIAQHVGIDCKKAVGVFSLEMSKEQLVMRMLCSEARVDGGRVRTGHLNDRDFPKLVEAASRITDSEIFIDDTAGLSVTELRAKARRLHREHPLSMIIVDYLQLMRSPEYSRQSREQEISDISRSLKGLSKDLHIPVIALSQLNRSVEGRAERRPVMSDLRESGAIEQDADVIMFIYRDEVYNPDSADKGVAEIIIGKQRNGPTGTVRLAFCGDYTRFDNLAENGEGLAEPFSTKPSTQAPGLDDNLLLDSAVDDFGEQPF